MEPRPDPPPLSVVLHTRKPRPGRDFGVEQTVQDLLAHAGPGFRMSVARARFLSKGVFRRLWMVLEAALRQGDINHITGDVHFLSYLLDRRRTVLTVLDCGSISGALDWRKRLLRLLWFRIPARRCAAVTVISEAAKQDLLRHVDLDPGKVRVVPVAVPSQYAYVPKPFRRDRPTILQVGTAPNKNVERLVEALAGIPCRLEIVGPVSPGLRARLEHCRIEFGSQERVPQARLRELYEACDLVAFVSTFEGFGMPIVEANRVGRPVVTGNVASLPEVAGDAACLVDPFDVAAIRAGILRVIEDAAYRDRLVRNGVENAKRFDAERISRAYEAVYLEVAERKAAG